MRTRRLAAGLVVGVIALTGCASSGSGSSATSIPEPSVDRPVATSASSTVPETAGPTTSDGSSCRAAPVGGHHLRLRGPAGCGP